MKPTIAIFIHDPQCETECALGMIEGFVNEFDVRTFGLGNLHYNFLKQFDVVAFPGGMGDSDDFYNIFTKEHISAVQTYVAKGGKYFGICMGAYWADSRYFNIVEGLEIDQYIERATSDIDTDGPTVAKISYYGKDDYMYFYDGCAIIGENIGVVAKYANGDTMAGIQGNVGLFGCHPEALMWWYEDANLDADLYTHKHAEQMCAFVNRLID